MNHLNREQAPFPERIWERIDATAVEAAKALMNGIHYHLFVCESMVLRLDEPEALCVLTG